MKNHVKIVSLKTALRIMFNKVHGFASVYDGTRFLKLFELGKYCAIINRIRYLIGLKSIISQKYEKIKEDSYYSLPLKKTLTFNNVIMFFPEFKLRPKLNLIYSGDPE